MDNLTKFNTAIRRPRDDQVCMHSSLLALSSKQIRHKVGNTYQKGLYSNIGLCETYDLQPPQLSTLITYDYNIYLTRCALIVYIVFLHHLSLFPPASAIAAACS